jgi:hypothetical protein
MRLHGTWSGVGPNWCPSMADAIHAENLEHPAMLDTSILAIMKQLEKHPLLQEIINPIITVEDFRPSF